MKLRSLGLKRDIVVRQRVDGSTLELIEKQLNEKKTLKAELARHRAKLADFLYANSEVRP